MDIKFEDIFNKVNTLLSVSSNCDIGLPTDNSEKYWISQVTVSSGRTILVHREDNKKLNLINSFRLSPIMDVHLLTQSIYDAIQTDIKITKGLKMTTKKELQEQAQKMQEELDKLRKQIDRMQEEKVSKIFKPESGKVYYYINTRYSEMDSYVIADVINDFNSQIGNCFRTEREAERVLKKLQIRQQLRELAVEVNNGEEIDWKNESQNKYYIFYSHSQRVLDTTYVRRDEIACGTIYCLRRNFLDEARESIGEDNVKLLFDI